MEVRGSERTDDGHIDSEPASEAPILERNIARSTTSVRNILGGRMQSDPSIQDGRAEIQALAWRVQAV